MPKTNDKLLKHTIAEPLHLALTRFEGRADLESPGHDLVVCNVPVQFDPVELVFEVHLPASHDLVQELVRDPSSQLHLTNVEFDSAGLGVRLEARSVKELSRQNSLLEWPEFFDSPDGQAADSATRRLVLGLGESKITFTAPSLLNAEHPYQAYYNNACGDLWFPSQFTPEGFATSVRFCRDHPLKGFIGAYSDSDFFDYEKRIHAALELIHGRYLPIVLKVQGRQISFYGHRKEAKNNFLPLVNSDPEGKDLTNAVLAALLAMRSDEFRRVLLAQKFFLLGKQVGVPMEAQYLMMMTCIEAMDGKDALKDATTSQMLGVSLDAARLLNSMRHQLTHGKGGYREAFQAVFSHQFRHKQPDLEPAFKDCITAEHQCDFPALWLRLAERLDAFWCTWLGIPESLAEQRYSPVCLMPLPAPVSLLPVCRENTESNQTCSQVDELTRKNQSLKEKNKALKAQLAKQGKKYADLKEELATYKQSASKDEKPSELAH